MHAFDMVDDGIKKLAEKCASGDQKACDQLGHLVGKYIQKSFGSLILGIIKLGIALFFIIAGLTYAIALDYDVVGTIWMILAIVGIYILMIVLLAIMRTAIKEDTPRVFLVTLIIAVVVIVLTIVYIVYAVQVLASTWNV